MSGKILDKMAGLLGLEDDLEEDLEELEDEEEAVEEEVTPLISSNTKRNNKVVSIHTAVSAKVKIIKPSSYEEAVDICDELKNRKIIIVNTTELETKIAQRLLDFMGGASYALGGSLEEVEKSVYILAPSTVEVTNELKSQLISSKGIFNWNK
ncbi:cell division protein SepF [Clostridium tepidum]|jgi:cell division inhibitor SepF|uniref:Cell division protein SepF n=1 Tax=Clostridium tepidum TaxID=1962263 RepID=A0A1S9I5E3_9CLOT|nr:cell division protein SepF [Clostridium tepidum]MCR1933224.1 cell division protein SepF [Clostridium tepidum]MDU6877386.1 cell division protein SepF [Clostridium botulinum]OOO62721.1 cell division protein SepF [Clostridium tepidum]OOO65402.1 cell division protein SepF [Clostridium tepidum]